MIEYWDTSALIPCFMTEDSTAKAREWLAAGGDIPRFISWLTLFEFETVLKRKLGQKLLTLREYQSIQERWIEFQKLVNLIPIDERVSRLGLRLQKLYGLWTCDSIQLGCASLLQLEFSKMQFICLDKKLSHVAQQEGFTCPSAG